MSIIGSVVDEIRRESELRNSMKVAQQIIEDDVLPYEKITDYFDLPLETVKELA